MPMHDPYTSNPGLELNTTPHTEALQVIKNNEVVSRISGDVGAIDFGDIADRTREGLSKGVDALAICYYGLGAWVAEKRLRSTDNAIRSATSDEVFYDALGGLAEDVIVGEALASNPGLSPNQAVKKANMPDPPPLKRAISGMAEGQALRRKLKGSGTVNKEELIRRGIIPNDKPAPLRAPVDPENQNQLNSLVTLADRLTNIREGRKVQAKRIKMFGGTGTVAGVKTRALKSSMAKSTKRDLKAGRIDAFEALERKKARRTVVATNKPHVMVHTAHHLDELGESTLEAMDKAVDLAIERQVELTQKRTKLQRKASTRRAKQAAARVRIRT